MRATLSFDREQKAGQREKVNALNAHMRLNGVEYSVRVAAQMVRESKFQSHLDCGLAVVNVFYRWYAPGRTSGAVPKGCEDLRDSAQVRAGVGTYSNGPC
eukprot:COSAG02_NODE_2960_length_7651_cov_6.331435_1_plen_100_part_00